jgi:hypothetical protein
MDESVKWEWYALAILTGEALAVVYVLGSTIVGLLK